MDALGTKEKISFFSDQGVVYASTTMVKPGFWVASLRRYRDMIVGFGLGGLDTGQHRGVPSTGTGEYSSCRRFHTLCVEKFMTQPDCTGSNTDRVPIKNEVHGGNKNFWKRVGGATLPGSKEPNS